jgi:hypothetical protein
VAETGGNDLSDRHANNHRRGLGALVSALAFGAYVVLLAVPARAATNGDATCTYNAVNRQVTVSTTVNPLSLIVGAGGAILFDDDLNASDGTGCDTATVNNTDGIFAEPGSFLEVDLAGGAFGPGETPEASGTSEIEIDVDGSVNTMQGLVISGSFFGDTITAGNGQGAPTGGILDAGAVNLNDDNDADLTFTDNEDGIGDLAIFSLGGNDTISLNGGAGTGAFLEQAATLAEGGFGDDTVTGSNFVTNP